MGILNIMKGLFKGGSHQKASPARPTVSAPQVMQFTFLDTYKLSVDDTLVFTGVLSDSNGKIESGKKLTIPATQKHPAFTLEINGPHWQTAHGISSIVIKLNSPAEREKLSGCDFSNEIFYIEK
jgi:hypothetical protein